MSLKSGPKPKLENVSPAQWVSANALILADIIEKNEFSDISAAIGARLSVPLLKSWGDGHMIYMVLSNDL